MKSNFSIPTIFHIRSDMIGWRNYENVKKHDLSHIVNTVDYERKNIPKKRKN